ncbi:hypothetical protein ACN47E_008880 [Coniothyrium glycines]
MRFPRHAVAALGLSFSLIGIGIGAVVHDQDAALQGAVANPQPTCIPGVFTVPQRTIAYYDASNVRHRPCDKVYPSQLDVSGLTHLILSSAAIAPTTFAIELMHPDDEDTYKQFLALPDTVSKWIGLGFGQTSYGCQDPAVARRTWASLISTEYNRTLFAFEVLKFLRKWQFKGIHIDWEWAHAMNRGGNAYNAQDLLKALKVLREVLGKGIGLSVSLPAQNITFAAMNPGILSPEVDWFNIVTYDLHGPWDSSDPRYGSHVLPHTDLKEIDEVLNIAWAHGIPSSKINLGISNYGRGYTVTDSKCAWYGCAFTAGNRAGACTQEEGMLSGCEIRRLIGEKQLKSKFIEGQAKVKEISWDNQWIGYDDEESRAAKLSFANGRCLGGTALWAIDRDCPGNGPGAPFPGSSAPPLQSGSNAASSAIAPTPSPFPTVPISEGSPITMVPPASSQDSSAVVSQPLLSPPSEDSSKTTAIGTGSSQQWPPSFGTSPKSAPAVGTSWFSTSAVESTAQISAPSVGTSQQSSPIVGSSHLSTPAAGVSTTPASVPGTSIASTPAVGSSVITTPNIGQSTLSTPVVASSSLATPVIGSSQLSVPVVTSSSATPISTSWSPSTLGSSTTWVPIVIWPTPEGTTSSPIPLPTSYSPTPTSTSWSPIIISSSTTWVPIIVWPPTETSSTSRVPISISTLTSGTSLFLWPIFTPGPDPSTSSRTPDSLTWTLKDGITFWVPIWFPASPSTTSSTPSGFLTLPAGSTAPSPGETPNPTPVPKPSSNPPPPPPPPVVPDPKPDPKPSSNPPPPPPPPVVPDPKPDPKPSSDPSPPPPPPIVPIPPPDVVSDDDPECVPKDCVAECIAWRVATFLIFKRPVCPCKKVVCDKKPKDPEHSTTPNVNGKKGCKMFGCGCGWMGLPFGPGCPEHLIKVPWVDPCGLFGCNPCGIFGCPPGIGPTEGPLGFEGHCLVAGGCDPCPPEVCGTGPPCTIPGGCGPKPGPPPTQPSHRPKNCDPKDYTKVTERYVSCTEGFVVSELPTTLAVPQTSSTLTNSVCVTMFEATLTVCPGALRDYLTTTTKTRTSTRSSEAPACTRAPLSLDDDEGSNNIDDLLSSSLTFASNSTAIISKTAPPSSFTSQSSSAVSPPSSHQAPSNAPSIPFSSGSSTNTKLPTSIWAGSSTTTSGSSTNKLPTSIWAGSSTTASTKPSTNPIPTSPKEPPKPTPGPMDRFGMWKAEITISNDHDFSMLEWRLIDPNGFEAGKSYFGDQGVDDIYETIESSSNRPVGHSLPYSISVQLTNRQNHYTSRVHFYVNKPVEGCDYPGGKACSPSFVTEDDTQQHKFEVETCSKWCKKGLTSRLSSTDFWCTNLKDAPWVRLSQDQLKWQRKFVCGFKGY